jgi:pimeloyl-ACP methyl ester carboxylesterase
VRVEEHTIELDGTPVFYRSAPAAGVPRLYLHGAPTSSDDWLPFLERTGGIAPDLLGFGRSSKAGTLDYSPAGHADFIEWLLDELEVDSVKVVAHDWGAAGALVFAQRHPDRIEKLVLIDAVPLLDGFEWHRLGRALRQPGVGELVMGSVPRWYLERMMRRACVSDVAWGPVPRPRDRLRRRDRRRVWDTRLDTVWKQFDQGTQRAILRLYRSCGPDQLAAAGSELERVTSPALVVWGDRDPWLPPALADRYAARLPSAKVWKLADAGHWPWLDRAEVIDAVDLFLGDD